MQDKLIYDYNQLLDTFFRELAANSPLQNLRNGFGLTALSDGDAKENIRISQRAFRNAIAPCLRTWKLWSPDVYDAAMEVMRFNP